MIIDTGGSAFPVLELSQDQSTNVTTLYQSSGGITARDWFATHAPLEIPSWFMPEALQKVAEPDSVAAKQAEISNQRSRFVAWRWHYADLMIAARSA